MSALLRRYETAEAMNPEDLTFTLIVNPTPAEPYAPTQWTFDLGDDGYPVWREAKKHERLPWLMKQKLNFAYLRQTQGSCLDKPPSPSVG